MVRANKCYCVLAWLTGLAVKATMMLSPLIDEFFSCLFNQSEPKQDAAAKWIEGFLSAVPAKKIDDNSFADAALKKLFIHHNTCLPWSAAIERLFSRAGHRKFKLYLATANSAK